MAIVDAFNDPTAESDLDAYRSFYNLPACTTGNGCFRKINEHGGATPLPTTDAGWDPGDLAGSRRGLRDLPQLPHPAGGGELHLLQRHGNADARAAAAKAANQISASWTITSGYAP